MTGLLLAASLYAQPFQVGNEWRYGAVALDKHGRESEVQLPGELRLKVAVVRPVGRFTLIALEVLIDGVDAERLRDEMGLTLPLPVGPKVLVVSDQGLSRVDLSLADADAADPASLEAAMASSEDPFFFPAKPHEGKELRWKFSEGPQDHRAQGTLSAAGDGWSERWTGKACLAGDCTPFVLSQVFSASAGLLQYCELAAYDQRPVRCLKMIAREPGPATELPGTRPNLGAIHRQLTAKQGGMSACLKDNDVAELAFTIQPDGGLSDVKEKNLSGPAARCAVQAIAGVRFPAFKGAPVVVEKFSFSGRR